MRRGHPGRGGWRNDGPRHFNPRSGGNTNFRHPRSFQPSILDNPRYQNPNQLRYPFRVPPPFDPHHGPYENHKNPNFQDTNRFRRSNRQLMTRNQINIRHNYPRYEKYPDHAETYEDDEYFDSSKGNDRFHVNSLGDVDLRQNYFGDTDQRQPFSRTNVISKNCRSAHNQNFPWENKNYLQSHDKLEDSIKGTLTNKLPLHDYSGHRPPASDHYEAKAGTAIDNSKTFSRSVDDTVNIIRKKLLNRNDPQNQREPHIEDHDERNTSKESDCNTNGQQLLQQEPVQRRKQRSKQNLKSNCDKIKNNIVHQLFKMDKDRIHKLMDNPNSSTKFEFAINSLITESQNSLNRQLRAVAEKSLCGSRNDIIQYSESDTIYEDTFMKQMQCVLDPQDTILLEDIKPIVMAELNKILQLNDISNYTHNDTDYRTRDLEHCDQIASCESVEECSTEYKNEALFQSNEKDKCNSIPLPSCVSPDVFDDESSSNVDRNYDYNSNRQSCADRRRSSTSSVEKSCEYNQNFHSNRPLFEVTGDQVSEEDDPFDELDRQYHVAVDHSFINCEDPIVHLQLSQKDPSELRKSSLTVESRKPIKQVQHQVYDMKSINRKLEENNTIRLNDSETKIKQELLKSPDPMTKPINQDKSSVANVKKEKLYEPLPQGHKSESNDDALEKSSTVSKSRKRSIDQRPSHRKEKRKKSDITSPPDISKQILNKNIIINLNDCAKKPKEKCDSNTNSIFNLYFSKGEGEIPKDGKEDENADNDNQGKYVNRKESPQLPLKDKRTNKSRSCKHSSTVTIQSGTNETTSKADNKSKLKSINMFTEQPRKVQHRAHRNTSVPANISNSTQDVSVKTLPTKNISKQLTRKHVYTQVVRKVLSKECQTTESTSSCSRFSQTTIKKFVVKSVQTDPEKSNIKSTDAFERMKEIDMEIQTLLQEKFKLYHSLETKETCQSSIENLGMTVLNVSTMEKTNEDETTEDTLSADTIIDNFTNIPQAELEQIALESVQPDSSFEVSPKLKKKAHRKKMQEDRTCSISPTPRRKKKEKTPNISLLERIITDDRPIEEIISLDDLESIPANQIAKRGRKKTQIPKIKIKINRPQKQEKSPISMLRMYDIKDCSVVLFKEDLRKYLISKVDNNIQCLPETDVEPIIEEFHFQDDMLEVSEDIVIDGNCELKLDAKAFSETESVQVSEEIVLDNSQPCEEVSDTETVESQPSEDCKMYDYSADEDLRHDSVSVTGHGDAVLAIECIEDNFLAACLDGNVYYFTNEGQLLTTLRGSNLAVTCMTIVKEKYGTTVYTGSLDSRIRYYDLETGLEKGPECNVLSPIQTMDRAWDTVFVGTRTGFVLQFECKNNMLIPVSTIKFSEQSILALRALKEGPRKVLLVASRSETVTIKDAQTGLLLRTLEGPKMTVYTLLYEDGKVYCGTSSNQIQVFDYASGCHIGEHEGGKGAVCLLAAGALLFAGCYDGCVYVYRAGRGRPLARLRGPGVMLLSLAVVRSKIIAGYKDRSLYIWKIPVNILQEMVL